MLRSWQSSSAVALEATRTSVGAACSTSEGVFSSSRLFASLEAERSELLALVLLVVGKMTGIASVIVSALVQFCLAAFMYLSAFGPCCLLWFLGMFLLCRI